jgi:hypothetical protein
VAAPSTSRLRPLAAVSRLADWPPRPRPANRLAAEPSS